MQRGGKDMAFCTECGANVPEGVKFCTECGKPMGEAAQTAPAAAQAPVAEQSPVRERPPIQQPQTYPASPAQYSAPSAPGFAESEPPRGSPYAVMGVGSYIGHGILFSVPVVGWIICLITSFAAKNRNRRNYARAILIFLIIGIVISVALYFVFHWVSEVIMDYINGYLSESGLAELGSLKDMFDLIQNGAGAIPGQ
jgi:predicted nucleic acid-binding Zn ribbon protein